MFFVKNNIFCGCGISVLKAIVLFWRPKQLHHRSLFPHQLLWLHLQWLCINVPPGKLINSWLGISISWLTGSFSSGFEWASASFGGWAFDCKCWDTKTLPKLFADIVSRASSWVCPRGISVVDVWGVGFVGEYACKRSWSSSPLRETEISLKDL